MKAKAHKTVYTAEYKAEAVKLVTEQQLGVTQASQRLGMPMQTLASWVAKAQAGQLPKTANHNSSFAALEAENQRLTKALKLAEMERDILKKATEYFAKESQRGTRS